MANKTDSKTVKALAADVCISAYFCFSCFTSVANYAATIENILSSTDNIDIIANL